MEVPEIDQALTALNTQAQELAQEWQRKYGKPLPPEAQAALDRLQKMAALVLSDQKQNH